MPMGSRLSRVDEVLELVGLGDAADRRIGAYSLGMRQRLGFAGALLGDPPVLVLDEPANGSALAHHGAKSHVGPRAQGHLDASRRGPSAPQRRAGQRRPIALLLSCPRRRPWPSGPRCRPLRRPGRGLVLDGVGGRVDALGDLSLVAGEETFDRVHDAHECAPSWCPDVARFATSTCSWDSSVPVSRSDARGGFATSSHEHPPPCRRAWAPGGSDGLLVTAADDGA